MVEEEIKKRIAVIGSDEFTLGFRLVGVQETYDREDYSEQIKKLVNRDDLGIVVAHEQDIRDLPERVRNQVRDSVDPVVVPLSEKAESENLNERIRTVIGADIT